MKTLFRFVFIGIAAALSFGVIAVVAFVTFFDANAYKDELAQLVKQETGRELVFIGDVSLTFYPQLGMKLGAMTLSNPEGFGQRPMAKVTESSVSVDVASLFAMKPEIDQFVLRGLEVDLLTRADGANNWDDLAGGSQPAAEPEQKQVAADPSPESASDGEPMTIDGAFGGLLIEAARVRYENRQAGSDYQVSQFNLSTGRITPDAPFPLELSAVLSSEGQVEARINLSAGFQYLLDSGVVNIRDMSFSTSAAGPLLPMKDITLDLKTAALRYSTADGKLSMNGMQLSSRALGVLPELDSANLDVKTESLVFDTSSSQLTMGQLDIKTLADGSLLPLGKISAGIAGEKLAVDLNQRSVVIDGLLLAVDDTRFSGNLNVIDYAQPAVSFKLASDNLDVDALLGTPPPQPPEEGETTEAEPQPVATGSAEDVQISLPVELMRSLFIDGEITAKQARVQNVRMKNLALVIKANEGLIRLNPLSLDLYDGGFEGSVAINVRGDQPVYQIKNNLQAVQVGDLLNDFMLLDKIGGAMSASIDVKTRGEWLSELKRNSNGNISLNFKDGALKGFNLRHAIEEAKAKLEQKDPPPMQMQQTDFSALGISGVIRNGIFSSDDLNLQAPLIRVGGKGKADLNNSTVDYLVTAKVVGTVAGQDSGTVGDLAGLLIPVRIKGPFASPGIDVRYNEMLDDALEAEKRKLAAEVERQKQELQRQLDAEKRKLEKARQREIEKLRERQRLEEEKARIAAEARLAEEQRKAQAQLEAEKKKARKKIEDELQKLLE